MRRSVRSARKIKRNTKAKKIPISTVGVIDQSAFTHQLSIADFTPKTLDKTRAGNMPGKMFQA
jgi:hypothetical protein